MMIKNKKFDEERALYGSNNITVTNCKFSGPKDGESALKESKNVKVKDSYFNLRYPLWHDDNITLDNCYLTKNCRAALWYTSNAKITSSKLHGIKALRECKNINVKNTSIDSPEFGWRCNKVSLDNCKLINTDYLFFESKNISLNKVNMKGKYSFQYVENLSIENSIIDTKDAFWHAKNVTVKNSTVKGQYLGWYSEDLTLINCKIIGTQPLCYCKKLKLVNCTMEKTDLSFEYSDVNASIKGTVLSIKNPKSGKIVVDKVKEIVLSDSVIKTNCKIIELKK